MAVIPWSGLPSGVRREVDDVGFLEIIRACRIDHLISLIATCRSSAIDSAWIKLPQR